MFVIVKKMVRCTVYDSSAVSHGRYTYDCHVDTLLDTLHPALDRAGTARHTAAVPVAR